MEPERELYASTISSVVEYFEGYGTLAVILNVSVDDLRRWAEGKSRPPVEVFLRIVDFDRAASERGSLTPFPPLSSLRRGSLR
jgi:hypothetical protein